MATIEEERLTKENEILKITLLENQKELRKILRNQEKLIREVEYDTASYGTELYRDLYLERKKELERTDKENDKLIKDISILERNNGKLRQTISSIDKKSFMDRLRYLINGEMKL